MKKTAFILLSLLPAAAVQAASLPLDIHTQTHTRRIKVYTTCQNPFSAPLAKQ